MLRNLECQKLLPKLMKKKLYKKLMKNNYTNLQGLMEKVGDNSGINLPLMNLFNNKNSKLNSSNKKEIKKYLNILEKQKKNKLFWMKMKE